MKLQGSKALEAIIGKTISYITGVYKDSDEVEIGFTDGSELVFYHEYSCCEQVSLYDYEMTVNENRDLFGGVINDAREDTGDASDDSACCNDSGTWTFYNINTSKGCLNMRWLGESNGYYSEAVDVVLHNAEEG